MTKLGSYNQGLIEFLHREEGKIYWRYDPSLNISAQSLAEAKQETAYWDALCTLLFHSVHESSAISFYELRPAG